MAEKIFIADKHTLDEVKTIVTDILNSPTNQSVMFDVPGVYYWTVPDNVTLVTLYGAGGGSGGDAKTSSGYGNAGGAGAHVTGYPINVTPGEIIPITIGAGGAGGTKTNTKAGAGGITSFGDKLSIEGGGGTNSRTGGSAPWVLPLGGAGKAAAINQGHGAESAYAIGGLSGGQSGGIDGSGSGGNGSLGSGGGSGYNNSSGTNNALGGKGGDGFLLVVY